MSRVSAFLRRVFGAVQPILSDIRVNVVGAIVQEIKSSGATSDTDRREIAKRVVKEYIAKKWPNYGWLADRAVDFVWETVRSQLRRRASKK